MIRTENYTTNDATKIRGILNEYGVAVLTNVINKQECDQMTHEAWDFLEELSRNWGVGVALDRNNESTWNNFKELWPKHGLIFQQFKPHSSKHVQNVRQNPKIVQVWATIWNCRPEDLLTSSDGFSFKVPSEKLKNTKVATHDPNRKWEHLDEGYGKNDGVIQSWVTAHNVEEGDATLGVIAKSHLYKKEIEDLYDGDSKRKGEDFQMLSSPQKEMLYTKGCQEINVVCPAGSMVFWFSRTAHWGKNQDFERPHKNHFRNIVYVCMMPKKQATIEEIERKKYYFLARRATSHHPFKFRIFPDLPHTYGSPVKEMNYPEMPTLTELGAKNVGFSSLDEYLNYKNLVLPPTLADFKHLPTYKGKKPAFSLKRTPVGGKEHMHSFLNKIIKK